MAIWKRTKSPYLKTGRLSDVLAAIQVMGSAKRPEAKVSDLAYDLDRSRDPATIERWTSVFRDHREFFLVYRLTDDDGLKAALRWRYVFERFDPETSTEYSPADIAALDAKQAADKAIKDRLTTKPLTTEQIQALMNTAVGLRATAMEEDRARVWWVPLVAAALAFVGTIVGTWLTAFLGVRR